MRFTSDPGTETNDVKAPSMVNKAPSLELPPGLGEDLAEDLRLVSALGKSFLTLGQSKASSARVGRGNVHPQRHFKHPKHLESIATSTTIFNFLLFSLLRDSFGVVASFELWGSSSLVKVFGAHKPPPPTTTPPPPSPMVEAVDMTRKAESPAPLWSLTNADGTSRCSAAEAVGQAGRGSHTVTAGKPGRRSETKATHFQESSAYTF